LKFQATADKTAKNLRGLFFSAAPCIYFQDHLQSDLNCDGWGIN